MRARAIVVVVVGAIGVATVWSMRRGEQTSPDGNAQTSNVQDPPTDSSLHGSGRPSTSASSTSDVGPGVRDTEYDLVPIAALSAGRWTRRWTDADGGGGVIRETTVDVSPGGPTRVTLRVGDDEPAHEDPDRGRRGRGPSGRAARESAARAPAARDARSNGSRGAKS
jgi:hypothetical protein